MLGAEFDVVATAENGKLALECVRCYKPDVAVLDLEMPILNGIEATRELRKLGPTPAVVICSVESDREIVEVTHRLARLAMFSSGV